MQNDNELFDSSYLLDYKYIISREIGRGGYAIVYKALSTDENSNKKKKFAIKINFPHNYSEVVESELAFYRILKGKENLPKITNFFFAKLKPHIVMEYKKHDLFIDFFESFSMAEIKIYLYSLLSALKTLKDFGIVHRDVKPGNFLFSRKEKKGTLIDFGCAEIESDFAKKHNNFVSKNENLIEIYNDYRIIYEDQKKLGTNKLGTEIYMPLESIIYYKQQSYSVDIWSVGVIFFQFLARKYQLFQSLKFRNLKREFGSKSAYLCSFIIELALIFGYKKVSDTLKVHNYDVKFPLFLQKESENENYKKLIIHPEADDQAEDLLKRLLEINQFERITVEDALKHGFFKDINK